MEIDLGRNGSIDQRFIDVYDADERIIHNERDQYAPAGVFETVLDTTYRADGQLDTVLGTDVIISGSSVLGPYGYGAFYSYDVEGYPLTNRVGYDTGGDPLPEIVTLTTHSWTCP